MISGNVVSDGYTEKKLDNQKFIKIQKRRFENFNFKLLSIVY